MTLKQLVNFSVYPCDIERFDNDWDVLESFLKKHGLDGIELLVGSQPLPAIPSHLVYGVHLPCPVGWFKVWRDEPEFEGMEDWEIEVIYGTRTRAELIPQFCSILENIRVAGPEYAVFHVTYVEPDQVFTRKHGCTNKEVLEANADFLNQALSNFPGGEPPVRLFFENLWWPGLTLLDPEETAYFTDLLEFDNWAFLLDTGHFMNAIGSCNEQEEAIDIVLEKLGDLPKSIINRIEGMHFHHSLSGNYQKENILAQHPLHLQNKPFSKSYSEIMAHINKIDQHIPFSSGRCGRIVELVSPDYLTHEFVTNGLEELDLKLNTQCGCLNHAHPKD